MPYNVEGRVARIAVISGVYPDGGLAAVYAYTDQHSD